MSTALGSSMPEPQLLMMSHTAGEHDRIRVDSNIARHPPPAIRRYPRPDPAERLI
eukprot:gene13017-biopygen3075